MGVAKMASSAGGMTVTKELELTLPPREAAYVVPESDWAHLRDCVAEIRSPGAFFRNLGWWMLGVAPTTLVAKATLPADTPSAQHGIYLAATVCAIVLGAMSLLFAHLRSRDCEADSQRGLKEFDRLAARYRTVDPDTESKPFSLREFLLGNTFTLTYDIPNGRKDIRFGNDGTVIDGNENEHSWRLVRDKLEFLTDKQELFSRFHFDLDRRQFVNVGDPDTQCGHSQRLSLAESDVSLTP
jgi:hypothetical protein